MTPMIPTMAALQVDGGRRPTCLGCSKILAEQGMLEIVEEFPLIDRQPEYSMIIYRIAPGFTLAECQKAIKDRHIGPAWGT